MLMRIVVQRTGAVLADEAEVADTITRRLIGLIGRQEIPKGIALVLPGVHQVHTFFMRFAIDLVCVDADWRVLCTRRCVAPWRFGPYCRKAEYAIELPAGTISVAGVEVGDQLEAEG
jgi:hypothetical protein